MIYLVVLGQCLSAVDQIRRVLEVITSADMLVRRKSR